MTKSSKELSWKEVGQYAQQAAKIQIGKKGITETLKEELRQRVKKEGVVKVRVLKNSPIFNERKTLLKQLAEEVDSKTIRIMGHTALFVHNTVLLPNEKKRKSNI